MRGNPRRPGVSSQLCGRMARHLIGREHRAGKRASKRADSFMGSGVWSLSRNTAGSHPFLPAFPFSILITCASLRTGALLTARPLETPNLPPVLRVLPAPSSRPPVRRVLPAPFSLSHSLSTASASCAAPFGCAQCASLRLTEAIIGGLPSPGRPPR